MKYSTPAGVIAALCLIITCFLPWVYIEAINTTITGMSAPNTNFGKPGIMHIFFAILAILMFCVPKIWVARINIIVCVLNFAWAIRNIFITTRCEAGECPERKIGIYLIVLFAFSMLVMSLLPKVQLPPTED